MQGRARGHLPLCASILPADMPVKDPAASSPRWREAACMWLMPVLTTDGKGNIDINAALLKVAEIKRIGRKRTRIMVALIVIFEVLLTVQITKMVVLYFTIDYPPTNLDDAQISVEINGAFFGAQKDKYCQAYVNGPQCEKKSKICTWDGEECKGHK